MEKEIKSSVRLNTLQLRRGYTARIQANLAKKGIRVSKQYISLVRHGVRNNADIYLAIAELYNEDMIKIKQANKLINGKNI